LLMFLPPLDLPLLEELGTGRSKKHAQTVVECLRSRMLPIVQWSNNNCLRKTKELCLLSGGIANTHKVPRWREQMSLHDGIA
jgi:hypothetical protein